MKKILLTGLVVLVMSLAGSMGYSQDTTTAVPSSQTAAENTSAARRKNQDAKWQYSFSFAGKKVSGYTEYHINYPIIYYAYPGEGHSVLAYPIDGKYIEVTGIVTPGFTKKSNLVFELACGKTITTPKEAMVDSDYIYISYFAPPTWVYSATKSDVKYSDYDLSFMAGFHMLLNKQLKMTPVVGYQSSHKGFDVIGLSGWWEYYYMDKIVIESEDYAGMKVATYEVDFQQISTGLILETLPNKGLSFYFKGLYYPYVKAKDHDDHILRLKESNTEASGKGYLIDGRIKIQAHKFSSGSELSWGGGYSLLRITATGHQIQRYYADSPDFTYDETGIESDPIDNTLKLKQNSFIAFIEYKI